MELKYLKIKMINIVSDVKWSPVADVNTQKNSLFVNRLTAQGN